jgi:hypothetical protein
MNKREFYKELMKEYTFDSAKVRRFAKRSSAKGTRISVKRWWHIPSTVAVAAASLAIGVFTFFYSDTGSPVVNHGVMSPQERIQQADAALINARSSIGNKTVYLSFNNTMTFREMQNTLDTVSDTGNIIIEAVYVIDGDEFLTKQLGEVRGDSYAQIVGAKVSAPANLIEDLSRQHEVALVEIENDILNDETFIPFIAELIEIPEDLFQNVTDEIDSSIDAAPPVEKFVNLNLSGVIEASFISDYRFTAITCNSVILYEISQDEDSADLEINPVSEFSLYNHRTKLSASGSSMLISGSTENDSRRTVLLVADSKTASLEEINISDITDSGELIFAFYDDINGRIIIRARSADRNIIYVIHRESALTQTVFDSSEDAAVLAATANAIFYSVNNTTVYKYDILTAESTIAESLDFGETVSFERNADLSAFAVYTNGGDTAQIFDTVTETLSDIVDSAQLQSYRSIGELSELFSVSQVIDGSVRILLKN